MRYYLKSWKLRPTLATSGNHALALLYKKAESGVPYDLAVVDDELPDLKGLELARTMRSDQTLARTPVVLLCPFGNRVDPSMARLAGVTSVLSKPFLRNRLLEALTRLFAPTRVAEESEPQQPTKKASQASSSARELNILLAEDNAVNQMLVLRLLEKIGYRADVVEKWDSTRSTGFEADDTTSF